MRLRTPHGNTGSSGRPYSAETAETVRLQPWGARSNTFATIARLQTHNCTFARTHMFASVRLCVCVKPPVNVQP